MCNCGRKKPTRQGPTVTVAPVQPQPTRSVRSRAATTLPRQAATTLPRHATTTLATVDPAIWGPPLWRVLHTLAEHTTQTTAWPALLNALKTDIPCPDCRRHFTAWLRQHPYTLQPPHQRRYIMVDRKRVLAPPPQPADPQTYTRQWVLDLHNSVNRRSRKAQWSVEQVRDANTSLDAAWAALQALATLIGPGAYAQLAAMMPPKEPEAVVEEPPKEPEVVTTEQPMLVVEEPPLTEPVLVIEEPPQVAEQPPNEPEVQTVVIVDI